MKDIFKTLLILLTIAILYFLWGKLIMFFFMPKVTEYPMLNARFGTIMWHSSDKNGVFRGSYNDPLAVDHIYCYYPKPSANTTLLFKRQDNGDCSDWYGEAIFREASWASEQQKYQWD